MVDVPGQINAVQRDLRKGTVPQPEGEEGTVLVMTQTYGTDPADLWDAVTNGERIPRWFLPVSGDLRLGGHYQLEGNAGGRILRCDAPEHLSITWENQGQVSWVDVTLQPESEGQTRLELRHTAQVPGEFWETYGPGAVGIGWDMMLLGLALHVSGGSLGDGVDPMVWTTSAEGVAFTRASGERWREANVGFGASEDQARDAADRVFAFYTGAGG